MAQRQQTQTYLKVFIEVDDLSKSTGDMKSDDLLATPPMKSNSGLGFRSNSFRSNSFRGDTVLNPQQNVSSAAAQYTIVTITPQSTASDVCKSVARKRNLVYTPTDFELVMSDGDGMASYETILAVTDQPWQFQQYATKHGHLGDFHFIFRAISHNDNSDPDGHSSSESDPEFFPLRAKGQMKSQSDAKYPAGFMEKRGKNHRAWRKRYFVLIEDELQYYKRRDVYENGKDPIARIELCSPSAIVKILTPETLRKNGSTQIWYCFDIHTPKRTYSLRVDNYNDMLFWVRNCSRRNEANQLINGLDALIGQSEKLHADDDEQLMDKYSDLRSVLNDNAATDAYMKYLQSIHNEEFIHFWLDLKKYLSDYHVSSKDTQLRFASELYEKYIMSGAKRQLAEIKSKHRSNVKKAIESQQITKDMFDAVRLCVFNFLNRDSSKFFNSNEYFRFIVTYKCVDEKYEEKFEWIEEFEKEIEKKHKEQSNKMKDNVAMLCRHHGTHGTSPVLGYRAQSPVISQIPPGKISKSWTGHSAFDKAANGKSKKYGNKKGYGKSIFEEAALSMK